MAEGYLDINIDSFGVDLPATMALAVKKTKLIGTTSVASNIFIA